MMKVTKSPKKALTKIPMNELTDGQLARVVHEDHIVMCIQETIGTIYLILGDYNTNNTYNNGCKEPVLYYLLMRSYQ